MERKSIEWCLPGCGKAIFCTVLPFGQGLSQLSRVMWCTNDPGRLFTYHVLWSRLGAGRVWRRECQSRKSRPANTAIEAWSAEPLPPHQSRQKGRSRNTKPGRLGCAICHAGTGTSTWSKHHTLAYKKGIIIMAISAMQAQLLSMTNERKTNLSFNQQKTAAAKSMTVLMPNLHSQIPFSSIKEVLIIIRQKSPQRTAFVPVYHSVFAPAIIIITTARLLLHRVSEFDEVGFFWWKVGMDTTYVWHKHWPAHL